MDWNIATIRGRAGRYEQAEALVASLCKALGPNCSLSFWTPKRLLSRSRSCRRTLHSRALIAELLMFSTSAVWSMERPSMSRKTKTVREMGSRSFKASTRMLFNSEAQQSCSGLGDQSVTSFGRKSHSSFSKSSSRDISFVLRCLRSFISDWFTVIRISQVENRQASRKSAKCW